MDTRSHTPPHNHHHHARLPPLSYHHHVRSGGRPLFPDGFGPGGPGPIQVIVPADGDAQAVADQVMGPPEPIEVDGCARFDELDPREIRVLEQLGPFGAGNRRPTFLTRDVRLVGLPSIDPRNGDLRLRAVQDGQVLPLRMRGGARHFERLNGLRTPVDLVHSPRVAARSEEGPVELVTWQVHCPDPTQDASAVLQ